MGRSNRNQQRLDDITQMKELIDTMLGAVKELLTWKDSMVFSGALPGSALTPLTILCSRLYLCTIDMEPVYKKIHLRIMASNKLPFESRIKSSSGTGEARVPTEVTDDGHDRTRQMVLGVEADNSKMASMMALLSWTKLAGKIKTQLITQRHTRQKAVMSKSLEKALHGHELALATVAKLKRARSSRGQLDPAGSVSMPRMAHIPPPLSALRSSSLLQQANSAEPADSKPPRSRNKGSSNGHSNGNRRVLRPTTLDVGDADSLGPSASESELSVSQSPDRKPPPPSEVAEANDAADERTRDSEENQGDGPGNDRVAESDEHGGASAMATEESPEVTSAAPEDGGGKNEKKIKKKPTTKRLSFADLAAKSEPPEPGSGGRNSPLEHPADSAQHHKNSESEAIDDACGDAGNYLGSLGTTVMLSQTSNADDRSRPSSAAHALPAITMVIPNQIDERPVSTTDRAASPPVKLPPISGSRGGSRPSSRQSINNHTDQAPAIPMATAQSVSQSQDTSHQNGNAMADAEEHTLAPENDADRDRMQEAVNERLIELNAVNEQLAELGGVGGEAAGDGAGDPSAVAPLARQESHSSDDRGLLQDSKDSEDFSPHQPSAQIKRQLKVWESPEAAREVAAQVLQAAKANPFPEDLSVTSAQGVDAAAEKGDTGGAATGPQQEAAANKPWWAQSGNTKPPTELQRKVVKEYRKKEETFSRLHSTATKSSAGSSSDPSPRQRLKAAGATAMVAASVKRATSSEMPPAAAEQPALPAALWAEKSEVQNFRGWTRDAEVCKADVSFSDMQAMAGSTQRMMENLEGGDTLEN